MRRLPLGETGIETTVLAFGCADLFRAPGGATGRRALLETAYELGVRHFDAAPMYGLGAVEQELGAFARGRRDELVLATKFGISPTGAARALAPLQAPLRRRIGARGSIGDPRRLLYRTGRYSASEARASLEHSLRALSTDHVDLLFLHDPAPGTAVSDDLRGYIESAQAAGQIRAWGVAGDEAHTYRDVPVVQVRGDRAVAPGQGRIRFGVIWRTLRLMVATQRWQGAPEDLAGLLVRASIATDQSAPVLFGTSRIEHVRAVVAAAEEPPDEALTAFRSLLREVEA